MSTLAERPVLSDLVWNAEGAQLWLKRLALVAAGVAALTVSAKVQITTVPVPVTLQMLVVMVIGAAYGPRLAGATLASYLALGFQGKYGISDRGYSQLVELQDELAATIPSGWPVRNFSGCLENFLATA